MKERIHFQFRIACMKDAIRAFFRFLRFLPGFWELHRFWDTEPEFYGWVIRQYSTVMNELTGGRLSKPSHCAETVIDEIWAYMDRNYAGWNKEETK